MFEVKSDKNRLNFKINDTTDTVEVLFFTKIDMMQNSSQPQLEEGLYYRIVGRINVFKDNRQVNCVKYEQVRDFCQLTYHLLNIMLNYGRSQTSSNTQIKVEVNANAFQPLGQQILTYIKTQIITYKTKSVFLKELERYFSNY